MWSTSQFSSSSRVLDPLKFYGRQVAKTNLVSLVCDVCPYHSLLYLLIGDRLISNEYNHWLKPSTSIAWWISFHCIILPLRAHLGWFTHSSFWFCFSSVSLQAGCQACEPLLGSLEGGGMEGLLYFLGTFLFTPFCACDSWRTSLSVVLILASIFLFHRGLCSVWLITNVVLYVSLFLSVMVFVRIVCSAAFTSSSRLLDGTSHSLGNGLWRLGV